MSTQLARTEKPSALAVMAGQISVEDLNSKGCLACLKVFPVTSFYLKGKDTKRRDSRCKTCRSSEVRAYRAKNPEIVKAIQDRTRAKHAEKHRRRASKWYRDNHEYAKKQMAERRKNKPEVIKNEKLRLSFGITLDDYNNMMMIQNSCCAICSIDSMNFKRKLAVDHCHKTGRVRGLLCGKCNSAIGLMNDSTENLQNAISYLNKK